MLSFIKILIYMAIMTTSFDIFLSWQLGGTIRFCQVVMIAPYVYLIYIIIKRKCIIIPQAFRELCVWNMFILIFVLNTDVLTRSLGYFAWLTMNITNIILLVNVFTTKAQNVSLLRIYCMSFVAVSLFGLFQFVTAPILQMNTPFVAQWWIPGVLARINGFSYEPSYFATYILMGWCFLFVLFKKNNQELFGSNSVRLMLAIVTLAMILSSSRMGILMILIISIAPYVYINCKRFIMNILVLKLNVSFIKRVMLTMTMALFVGYVLHSDNVFDEYSFLLSGTGIGGTPAHSVDTRSDSMRKTLEVFFENPIIGVSIGGVAEKIAQDENQSGNLKDNEGTAVGLEVLAASGIIGIIPFLVYFYKIIKKSFIRFIYSKDDIGKGLLLALLAEIAILQLNQNILRPYFWMHIAVLSVYLRYKSVEEKSESND